MITSNPSCAYPATRRSPTLLYRWCCLPSRALMGTGPPTLLPMASVTCAASTGSIGCMLPQDIGLGVFTRMMLGANTQPWSLLLTTAAAQYKGCVSSHCVPRSKRVVGARRSADSKQATVYAAHSGRHVTSGCWLVCAMRSASSLSQSQDKHDQLMAATITLM